MKCQSRNKQAFYYSLYLGKEPIYSKNGDFTAQYRSTYSEPIKRRASISASKGDDSIELFGIALDYDKTIIIDGKIDKCPIDENSLIFIDKEPIWDENTKNLKEQDYIITRISKSLNFIAIAVKKVKENG